MANKTLNTRIQMKHDTTANWNKATNFIPLAGELILYTDVRKIKIGDGSTKVGSLQFLNQLYEHCMRISCYSNSKQIFVYLKAITTSASPITTATQLRNMYNFSGYVSASGEHEDIGGTTGLWYPVTSMYFYGSSNSTIEARIVCSNGSIIDTALSSISITDKVRTIV